MFTSGGCVRRSMTLAQRHSLDPSVAWVTSSMRFSELWRTTTFRLTALYGLLFALGTIALLGMVYLRSAVYLTERIDGILKTEADGLMRSPQAQLRERLNEELSLNGARTNVFGLFDADGARIAGNLPI